MSVKLEDVSVDFGDRRILHGICATFESGILTALTGPSGTGKTTLLGVIAGFILPSEGKVTVGGVAPLPEFVVWVPQGANALSARTLLDNVRLAPLSDGLPLSAAEKVASAQLEMVGLGGRESALARELSGGELQRLALARALASSRPLLLADEPTANLDSETSKGIIELLRSIRAERTMIIATHDPELVSAADRVVDLRRLDAHRSKEN